MKWTQIYNAIVQLAIFLDIKYLSMRLVIKFTQIYNVRVMLAIFSH